MRRLMKFFKDLKEERASKRRIYRAGDPSLGIEYNEINASYIVSSHVWKIDIARTPQVIKTLQDHVNVHGQAWVANKYNSMVNYRASKCYGRGRF
jgi:hypothetical protein